LAMALTGGDRSDLRSAAATIIDLNHRLGIPASLAAVGLAGSDMTAMAAECTMKYPRPTNPVAMTEARVAALYDAWYANDLDAAWSL
jgi:alcohol dehydrogenase class IV